MPSDAAIDDLRRQIDEIDTRLHDLLMRRSSVVAEIGALKGNNGDGNGYFRPGREAAILRRLVERHQGSLPKTTVIRMWREMLSATLRQQGPFAVAVFAPDDRSGYWDVARDHFGSLTPAVAHEKTGQVLRAVVDGQAAVGVLPLPHEGDRQPWWPFLVSKDPGQPRIIARLPFGAPGNLRGGPVEALVIGRAGQEETGRDRTLVVVEAAAEISRSGLRSVLAAASLAPEYVHLWRDPSAPSTWYHLVEVDGCLRPEDPRFAVLAATRSVEVRQIWPLGGYAVPLTVAELAPPAAG
jgi:chorismate mutase / prephenate dehydratase